MSTSRSPDVAKRMASVLTINDIPKEYRDKVIGRGTLTIVCEINESTVRVFTIDRVKYDWIRELFPDDSRVRYIDSIDLSDNPKFPNLYRVMQVFEMPRLYPLSADNKRALKYIIADVDRWKRSADADRRNIGYSAKIQDAYNKLFDDSHDLFRLMSFMLNYGDSLVLDVHRGNVMQDSTGKIHIIDPVIEREVYRDIIGALRDRASFSDNAATVVTPKGFTTYRYVGKQGIAFESPKSRVPRSVLREGKYIHVKPSAKKGWFIIRVDNESHSHPVTNLMLARVLRSSKVFDSKKQSADVKAAPHLPLVRPLLAKVELPIKSKSIDLNRVAAWAMLHSGVRANPNNIAMAVAYNTDRLTVIENGKTYTKKYLMAIGDGLMTLRKLFGKQPSKDAIAQLFTALRTPSKPIGTDLQPFMKYHDRKWKFTGTKYTSN